MNYFEIYSIDSISHYFNKINYLLIAQVLNDEKKIIFFKKAIFHVKFCTTYI